MSERTYAAGYPMGRKDDPRSKEHAIGRVFSGTSQGQSVCGMARCKASGVFDPDRPEAMWHFRRFDPDGPKACKACAKIVRGEKGEGS